MDEKKPLTKEERRERRRRLEPAKKSRKDGAKPSAVHPENAASGEVQAPPERSGRQKRPQITEADVQGLKYFDKLAPLLQRLHDEGCERDAANNRTLHYDQYCMLILLSLFNPIVTALRGIQQAIEATWRKADSGSGMVKWRLHTHFELLRGVPTRIDVTPNGGGPQLVLKREVSTWTARNHELHECNEAVSAVRRTSMSVGTPC